MKIARGAQIWWNFKLALVTALWWFIPLISASCTPQEACQGSACRAIFRPEEGDMELHLARLKLAMAFTLGRNEADTLFQILESQAECALIEAQLVFMARLTEERNCDIFTPNSIFIITILAILILISFSLCVYIILQLRKKPR